MFLGQVRANKKCGPGEDPSSGRDINFLLGEPVGKGLDNRPRPLDCKVRIGNPYVDKYLQQAFALLFEKYRQVLSSFFQQQRVFWVHGLGALWRLGRVWKGYIGDVSRP